MAQCGATGAGHVLAILGRAVDEQRIKAVELFGERVIRPAPDNDHVIRTRRSLAIHEGDRSQSSQGAGEARILLLFISWMARQCSWATGSAGQ
jgi:hypothetical protein